MDIRPHFRPGGSRLFGAVLLLLSALPARAGLPADIAVAPDGKPLSAEDTAALEAGKVLVHLAEVAGAEVKEATAAALIDAPPDALYAILTDYARFPEFMAYVEKTEVLGKEDETTRVQFHLDLPWPVGNRHYILRMTETTESAGGQDVLVSGWTCEPGSGNINDTQGEWKVTSYDAKRSFVRYRVLTDPGGKIPVWLRNQATSIAVPKVIAGLRKECAKRAKQEKAP